MKIILNESHVNWLNETLILKNVELEDYAKIVNSAYNDAPINDPKAHSTYSALNQSNYLLYKRLLSKVKIEFVTEYKSEIGKKFSILNNDYVVKYNQAPYSTMQQMSNEFKKSGVLQISVDYSDHPYFSVVDNIVFRTVHDYIVHILGHKQFGLKGELLAYNLHAKLVPSSAKAAIFTEVVGQVCYFHINNSFPTQKCAILEGFDYDKIGKVEDWVLKKYES